MTIEVSLLISGISVAAALYFGTKTLRRNTAADVKTSTSDMTTVIVKLENINTGIVEIKNDLRSTEREVKDITERLVVVEQSAKQAHKMIDEMSGKVRT